MQGLLDATDRICVPAERYCGLVTLAAVPGEDWDSHLLLLYHDQSDRVASVVSWVHRGLDRGDKIFYSTVPGEPALMAALVPALESGGDGVARAMRDGQFSFISLEEFFPGAQQAALARRALAEGYPGVRFSAQADAALQSIGERDYRAIDELMEELCRSSAVSALCLYGARGDVGTSLSAVLDSHPHAVRDALMRLRRDGNRIEVAGEVDLASAQVLAGVLQRSYDVADPTETMLDVSRLEFIDVAGCRGLVIGTEDLRRAGGTVFVQGSAGHIRKVMSLVGLDRLPGMRVV